MTPARPADPDQHDDLVTRIAASLQAQAATLATLDGRYVTGGIAEFSGSPMQWLATLRQLDRPGVVASLYFAEGVRDVIMRLEDGRTGRARISGTTFSPGAQRVCELVGAGRLG